MINKLPSGLTEEEKTILLLFLANERSMKKFQQKLVSEQDVARRTIKLEVNKLLHDIARKEGRNLVVYYRDLVQRMNRKQIKDFNALVKSLSKSTGGAFPSWLKKEVRRIQREPTIRNLLLFLSNYPIVQLNDRFVQMAGGEWGQLAEDIGNGYLKYFGTEKTLGKQKGLLAVIWHSGNDLLNFKERIELNARRVGIALFIALEQEIVQSGSLETIDEVIDKRLDIQERDFQRLTQTGSTLVSNIGLLRAFELAGYNAFQHISVLDNRTTPLCISRHGKIFPLSEAVQGVTVPPLHDRCRSGVVPAMI